MKPWVLFFLTLLFLSALAFGGWYVYNILNEPLPTPQPTPIPTVPEFSGTVALTVPENEPEALSVPETPESELFSKVNTHALNVRNCGDFYSCSVLTTLPKNTFIKAYLCEGNWANIYFPVSGWVNSNYLEPDICQ